MKRVFTLVFIAISFITLGTAQTLDKYIEKLETARNNNGELSEEYLQALDSVILQANALNGLNTAILYREKHLETVKKLKGDDSIETADDLWRLGNLYHRVGDLDNSMTYYFQAEIVFGNYLNHNKIPYKYVDSYVFCLFSILDHYKSLMDQTNVSLYSAKLAKFSTNYYGISSSDNFEVLSSIGYFNDQVGNKELAFDYCKIIVDNCTSIDSSNYKNVDAAYSFIKSHYYNKNEYGLMISTATEHLNKLDSASIDLTNEIIDALYYLMVMQTKDIGLSISYGKRAEQLLQQTHKSIEDLYLDPKYYRVVSGLALDYDIISDHVGGLHYHGLCREVLLKSGSKETSGYYKELLNCFNVSLAVGEYQTAYSFAEELEPLIFMYSETPMEDAYGYAKDMYIVCATLGKYEEALRYADEAYGLSEQILGESDGFELASLYYVKANIYNLTGRKNEALSNIHEGRDVVSKLQEEKNVLQVKSQLLSLESQIVDDFDLALALSDSAKLIHENLIEDATNLLSDISGGTYSLTIEDGGRLSPEMINALHDLSALKDDFAVFLLQRGYLLLNHGAQNEALLSFQKSAELFEDLKTKNSVEYLTCQNNISVCQVYIGDFSDAIITLSNVKSITESTYGKNHQLYATVLMNHGLYYLEIYDYDKALEYSQQAAIIFKELGDVNNYAKAVMNIGSSLLSKGNVVEAAKYLNEASDIMESSGSFGTGWCLLYRNLAVAFFEQGKPDDGFVYFDKAKQLVNSIYGLHSVEYAQLVGSIGWEMLFRYHHEQAYDAFLDAAGTMLSLGLNDNPYFLSSLLYYGAAGVAFDKPISSDFAQLFVDAIHRNFDSNTKYYASSDRDSYWSNKSFGIKNVLLSARQDSNSDSYLYDFVLFNKSLLLTTADHFKKLVYQTKDEEIIKQYESIVSLQKQIDNQNFNSIQNRLPIEEIQERLTLTERDLIGKMKASGAYVLDRTISYHDVVNALKSNEIAIEFVDYYHLKNEKTYYVALLAKPNWDKPVYVQLCTEDELKACLGNPNVTYSTDDLYRLLWKPLLEYVGDSCTVYFSPSGMLHTIALESLHTPAGSCLNDKYNLVRLTSTRELCKERQPKTYETGAVYGGLQYDVDQQRMTEVAAMNKTAVEESPVFALRGEDRGNWNYLQGTKDEAEHIAGIMRQANINCNLLEGDLGSEESFKALSGGKTDIIHFATHGYFLEGEKADMNDFMKSLSPLARQKTDSVIDPLLRSGLILSGGNNAWLGKEVPEGLEDGVLTALEISTMDLSETDMVVLSACETGLGDITSDGVFGLQRAFKMAGVQTLVMSLWKVDDNATSLMMQTFYEQLLSGKTKREAFNLAQAAVREKYPEPYYWAGFIMLD
jgi:CHAT domain-containing protein